MYHYFDFCIENIDFSAKRELEVNPETLSRRQKQIDYGKNTEGYDRYTKVVPKYVK